MNTSKKVLVIEDETPVQQLLQRVLTKLGYESTLASDGIEALNILSEQADDYSLVVTDLILPNCTGWEFLQLLKENALCNHIKTLVISGAAASSEEQERLKNMADHFILKPDFSIADFEKVLNTLLPTEPETA